MFSIPLPLLLMSLAFSVGLCVHAVRSGQDSFWLWIILMFQPLGGLVYLVAIVAPGLFRGRAARELGRGAREALDPHRDYREARAALADSPTVHNQMRLAAAAAVMGRHQEAEERYAEAAQGVHVDDPALLIGRAKSLIELGRHALAAEVLERLDPGAQGTGPALLAFARAYDGLARLDDADRAYRQAVERTPGLEAVARYAAFLRRTGRTGEANELVTEIDKRTERTIGPFRKEARAWRDLATHG